MRLKLVAAAGLFALSAISPVQGMEMRQKDADDFRDGLLSSFPDLANSDFLTVKPDGDRLELTLDFNSFFDGLDPKTFRMTGFGPWSLFITPQDNTTTKLNAETSAKASMLAKGADGKAIEGNFSIGSFLFNGLIVLPGSTQFKTLAKDIDVVSKLGSEHSVFRADSIDSTNLTGSSSDGRWDYDGSTFFSGIFQQSKNSDAPSFEFSADQINHEYHWGNAPPKAVNRLISLLIFGGVKTSSDFETLKAEILPSFPLLSSLDERVYADNLKVMSPIGNLTAKTLNARVSLQGETAAMRLGMSLSGTDIKMDGAAIPSGYEALLPTSLDMILVADGMDFAAAGKELAASSVSTDAEAMEAGRRFGSKLARDGDLPVVLKQLYLKSDLYDLSMFGSVRENAEKKAQMRLVVTARNFDKSIAAVQNLATTKPELNEVSFAMMMAKGFARSDAEGGLYWNVFFNEDGTLIVNEQQIQGPENPPQAQ